MKALWRYIKPYMGRMSLGLVIKLVGTLMDLVLPWVLARMLDVIVPSGNVKQIYLYGLLMVFCAFIAVVFSVGANRMASRVSSIIAKDIRRDLFAKVTRLSFAGADRYSVPSLISRLTNDTYNVHQLIDRSQRLGVRAPLLMLGGMVMAFLLEPTLALVLTILAPLLILVVLFVSKTGIPLYVAVQKSVEGLVRTVRENASGVRVVKALSKEAYEKTRFSDINEAVADAEKRAGVIMAVTNPTMGLLLNAGLMLVILIGAKRVNLGLMQPGTIIAFLSYFTIILNATLSVTKIFVLWSRGSASAGRIAEILTSPDDAPETSADHRENAPFLSFENVAFSYNGRRNNLENISFTLKKGGTLGILGPTGSGKTTLVSLLMRFYDAGSGEIRIGGDLVSSIPRGELSKRFGVVFQNDTFLTDTVYENISFLRELPMEDVVRAAETAQAAAFIENLPKTYDYRLEIRGMNLSGGQRQRLLIARALAGNPEILVLDDAESALDYRTTALLRASLRRNYPDTTLIVISERISSLQAADRILVLDDGREQGLGTHAELMETCPAYRRIANVQMGGAPA